MATGAQPARIQAPAICWSPGAVAQIRQKAIAGLLALPKRGVEVGGLLLGRVNDRPPYLVSVEEVREIESEHRCGPGFVLSELDHARLRDLLARMRGLGEYCVVGYYRSHTAPGAQPELDMADRQLIDLYFSDPAHIFLAVRPWSPRRCAATLYYWAEGELLSEGCAFELGEPNEAPRTAAGPEDDIPADIATAPPLTLLASPAPHSATPSPADAGGPSIQRGSDSAWFASMIFVLAMAALLVADLPHREPCVASAVSPAFLPPLSHSPKLEASALEPAASPTAQAMEHVARRAVVLDQVKPSIPDGIRNRIAEPISVAVKVRIDENGRVTSAEPEDYSGGVERYLARQAADAVRSARFRPAVSEQGRPLASAETITVAFAPR